MGSTVVLVLPRSKPAWRTQLALGAPVRMGQSFAVREA
jgi:hypothetical protein